MTKVDWEDAGSRLLGMFLNGEQIAAPDEQGQRIVDDSFVVLFNAGHEDVEFTLPPRRFGAAWTCELRTDTAAGGAKHGPGEAVHLSSRSIVLLRRTG
jgi:glycogen operon protein